MQCSDNEGAQVELLMQTWFSSDTFIKVSRIKGFPLLNEEKTLIDGAVLSRQQEFSTGRWLARQGLQHLGQPAVPIKIGRLRNPLWPNSVIGSITHDAGYCAVVLMNKQKNRELGVGIDLVALSHRSGQLDGLESMIMKNPKELGAVRELNLEVELPLLLFSIKESVIKALSFYLTDFIDMRSIEIAYADKLVFKLADCWFNADVFAAKSHHHLITAVKVYSIDRRVYQP